MTSRPLRSIIVIANADSTLAVEAMGPETSDIDVSLGDGGVCEQQPGTKDGLGEDVENGVGDDLDVDGDLAGTISDSPDAVTHG